MLEDILNGAKEVTVEGVNYKFEFDHASLAVLEKNTGKSCYVIYEFLVQQNGLMLEDMQALVNAGMLKHHKTKEINAFGKKLIEYPGLWHEIKEAVICAFLLPLMPPEILRNLEVKAGGKKKEKMPSPKKNTIG